MTGAEENQLMYIVGVGRSGTSLLHSMFAAHSRVVGLPETSFLRRYVVAGRLQSIFLELGREAAVERLGADGAFNRLGLSPHNLVPPTCGRGRHLDVLVYQGVLKAMRAGSANLLVDKDPRLIEFLPVLATILPDVNVLNIIRDPRDVVASKKKAAWSRKGHAWRHIFANRVQLKLGRKEGGHLFGANYHEILYEELIGTPEVVLKSLCQKLGLPFEAQMLDFGRAAKNMIAAEEISWKRETLGPLLSRNQGKWKSELEPREIILTESCCTEAMQLGSYSTDSTRYTLRIRDRLWVQVGRLLILLFTRPYIVYRGWMVKRACRRIL